MKYEIIPVTKYEQNCSLLWCEHSHKAAVIDPGGDLWLIESFLDTMELDLKLILITHGHFDHAGGACALSRSRGADIKGPHIDEAQLLSKLADYDSRAESFTPDRWLEDDDLVKFGNEELEVLHCPGHTMGHLAYYHRSSNLAFVGDILFKNSIGAWEHSNGNLPLLIHSIRKKLFPLGNQVMFIPGHGPTSTFGKERLDNPFVSDQVIKKLPDNFFSRSR